MFFFFWPAAMGWLRMRFTPPAASDFFSRIITEVVEHRERSGEERADLLNLLIKLKNEGFLPPDNEKEEQLSPGTARPRQRF